MLSHFKINEEEDRLSLTFTPYGLALPLNKLLLLVVIAAFATLSVSVNHMIGLLGMILVLIIAVISKTPGLQQTLNNWRSGKSFSFDKTRDEFSINGQNQHKLTDISGLEINYERFHQDESYELHLAIHLASGQRVRLLESNSYKEYKAAGRQIPHFCKVELWDNHPLERELLWGATQASDKDISAINERHSKHY